MRHAASVKGSDYLRELIPLNSLSEKLFLDIAEKMVVEEISPGSYLFGQGDSDNRSIYLLEGEVNFLNAGGRVTGAVLAGTTPSRYPLANQQPRVVSARVIKKAVIAHIDSTLLDVLLTFDQSDDYKTVSNGTDVNDDWLTRMFQSEAFVKLPPADIQRMLKAMESVPVKQGDVVIRQGNDGDYFYILREGRCSVTRRTSSKGWDVPLAELTTGDCFGEEALVSDVRRNASVTMLTDGTLMRLAKQDFLELLKKPLVHYVDYEQATSMIADGSQWLDVRMPDEYANHAFSCSINIPLLSLREQVSRLDSGKMYVICCDTGRRSASAAFVLSQRGFEVYVLEGGLNRGAPPGVFGIAYDIPDGNRDAEVLDFEPKDSTQTAPPATAVRLTSAVDDARPGKITPHRAELDTLRQERDAARRESEEAGLRLRSLHSELTELQNEMTQHMKNVQRLEAAMRKDRHERNALQSRLDELLRRFASSADPKK